MANMRTYKPSFAGGELSPEMFGRIDDVKFQQGAASLENFISTALGPAEKRPGFEFVAPTRSSGVVKLIPFQFSTTQTMVVEVGDGYFRFHTMGATLLYNATQRPYVTQAAVTFTVANPTVVTWTAHGLQTGDLINFGDTGGVTYPAPVNASTQYIVTVIDANTFNITDPSGALVQVTAPASGGTIYGLKLYVIGELCSYSGSVYYCFKQYQEVAGASSNPSVATTSFYLEPSDLTYEIPSIYSAADVFDIHYVQSNDIITMVHPSYPPSELRRLGATDWTFTPILFGPAFLPPTGVAVVAKPGYQAKISTASGSPSLITTVTNHTLALGDPIYLKGTSGQDGFYLVASVPIDPATGALIPNELYLMDLSGNSLTLSGTYAGATIQFGSQIFNITNFYVVTTIGPDSIQESAISSEVSVLNNLNVTGSFNTISWNAATGAFRYYIYKKRNGLYGYIGETPSNTLTFNDNNIAPDFSITPPIYDTIFGSADNYPGAVTYFQQRRSFAGTNNQPQNLWMSKSGTESDFSHSLPVKDTDRVAIGIAARQSSTILHMIPLNQLLLLTNSSEISVSPTNSDTITPTTISARPQSYVGASNVQPTITNNTMVYCANRGGHVREIGYQFDVGGYITGDVSLRAAHLFDNLAIVDQAYMKAPYQIIWFVSSSGNLLGFTYIPEEKIGAWHHHVTDGIFESVTCVSEGVEDRLYAVIRRTINGSIVRYIERMSTRNFVDLEDSFFVDSGASYDGTNSAQFHLIHATANTTPGPLEGTWNIVSPFPTFVYPSPTDVGSVLVMTGSDGNQYRFQILSVSSTTTANSLPLSSIPNGVIFFSGKWAWARPTFSNLNWLEGKTVSILGDGAVSPSQVVTGGIVNLQYPAVKVTIGLPYTSAMESLPLVMQVDGFGQGRHKNVNTVWIRVYRSSAIFAGPSEDNLVEYKQRTTEPYGSPPSMITDEVEIKIPASWNPSGQVFVEHSDPLPLTLVGLTIEAAVGG
jgi:hypothetical protein